MTEEVETEQFGTFRGKSKTVHLVWGEGNKSKAMCGKKLPKGIELVPRPYPEVTCKTCRKAYEAD